MKAQFILQKDPTVRWPVTVAMPADGGAIAEFRFEAAIRVLSEADYERILPPQAEGEGAQEAEIKRRTMVDVLAQNARILPQFVADWFGPADPTGAAVPVAALPEQLTGPYGKFLAVGLYRAVFQVRNGIPAEDIPGASEGNSAPLPAAG